MSRVDKWHQKQQSKYIFLKYTRLATEIISLPLLYKHEKRKHSKKSFSTMFKIVINFRTNIYSYHTVESLHFQGDFSTNHDNIQN